MAGETLELSKLESKETFQENKKVSISDLVMESWQTLKPLAEKKDIKIKNDRAIEHIIKMLQ